MALISKGEETQKLQRIMNPDDDVISNLPDHLIEQILGFLHIKEAIRTCVLSKRWRHSWMSITNLNFSRPHGYLYKEDANFAAFINRTLTHFSNSHMIKKLHLALDLISLDYKDCIGSWVEFGLNHEVEELCLEFSEEWKFKHDRERMYGFYVLPPCIYEHNSSLKKLSLRHCLFGPLPKLSWVSLKVLSLSEVFGGNIEVILSGSPVLECLKLYEFQCMYDCIRIASTSLKVLVLHHLVVPECNGRNPVVMEISCPNLLSLAVMGRVMLMNGKRALYSSLKWALLDVSSLVEATIDFDISTHSFDTQRLLDFKCFFVDDLFQQLSHVTKLKIGPYCLEFLSMLDLSDDLDNPLPMSSNKYLVLNAMLSKLDFHGVLRMLESSPDLQKLTLQMKPCDYQVHLSVCVPNRNWKRKSKRRFKCIPSNLKCIEINGFDKYGSSLQLIGKLLLFMLKNAIIQKIVVSTQEDVSNWSGQYMSVHRMKKLLRSYNDLALEYANISLCVYLSARKKRNTN